MMIIMRHVAIWVALLLVEVWALAPAWAAPATEGGDWAIWAGDVGAALARLQGPGRRKGERLGVFLVGERWVPQVFAIADRVLDAVPVGGQGRLTWRTGEGGRKAVNFDPAEVPLRRSDMMEGDRPVAELPLWRGRSRAGVLVLLLSMEARDKDVVQLGKRWRKDGELPAGEWARFLYLSGARKELEALAKKDGAAAYEVVGMSFAAGSYARARALLGKKGVAARVDQVLGGGLAWSQLLIAAALQGQGKGGEARRVLGKVGQGKGKGKRKGRDQGEPRGDERASLIAAALAAPVEAQQVLQQEPPAVLALRVPGFREVLESLR